MPGRLLAILTAALVALPLAAGATNERRIYSFVLDWGQVELVEIHLDYTRNGEKVVLNTAAWSVGPAKALFDFNMRQRAEYGGSERFYQSASDWGEGRRERVLNFSGGLLTAAEGTPPDEPLTPIPEAEMRDIVDPAFPWIDTLARFEAGQICGGTYRVFDGIRRMNITVVPLGEEQLSDDRGWTYEGPAVACGLKFQRVGGFPVESDWDVEEGEISRIIWFAPLAEGWTPVRVSVEWPLGVAVARIDLR